MPRLFVFLAALLILGARQLHAQHLMNVDAGGKAPQNRPDFFQPQPRKIADTTFEFAVYDKRDSLLVEDTLLDFSSVKYITFWQKYLDRAHTYKDKDGVPQPLPIAKIRHRYDKISGERWMKIDYRTRKMTQVTELKSDLSHRDTLADRIIQYYKTEEKDY